MDDIAEHAKNQNWYRVLINDSIEDEILACVKGDSRAEEEFLENVKYFKRSQYLVRIPRARVRDDEGFVFLPTGEVCFEGNWWLPNLMHSSGYVARYRPRRFISGHVFTLLSYWGNTFYHWFHDVLPRLLVSQALLPESTRFLVSSPLHDYQLESLNAFNITSDKLIFQQRGVDSLCEHLWFATPSGNCTFGGGEILRKLSDFLISRMVSKPQNYASRRIYISRRIARCRRLLNEIEIEPILRDFGFTTLIFEQQPFSAQISLAHNARWLVGVHGAGLTNALFMRQGASIVEIAGAEVVPCYSVMSLQLKHHFHRFSANQLEQDADLTVDARRFREVLEVIVSENS